MEEIVFSIVLVSRNRPSLLGNLLKSIENTAQLKYEVLVGLDDDDIITPRAFEGQIPENVTFFSKPRNPNLHQYLNWLVSQSKGKYIFGLNDDCEILNEGWDVESKLLLDTYGKPCYGVTNDNSIDKIGLKDYASFPVISKSAIHRLGFFMEETCGNHGSDVVTYRIYYQAGRTLSIPILIRHIYHETPTLLAARLHDQTAKEMIDRTMAEGQLNNLFSINVDEYVHKLLDNTSVPDIIPV